MIAVFDSTRLTLYNNARWYVPQRNGAWERYARRLACLQWGCDGPYSGVYAAPAAVFRLTFLGSVEVDEDGRRRKKRPKKNMVEEAVTKIKVVWLAAYGCRVKIKFRYRGFAVRCIVVQNRYRTKIILSVHNSVVLALSLLSSVF